MHKYLLSFALLLSSSALIPNPVGAQYSGLGKSSVDPAVIQRYTPKPLAPNLTRNIEQMLDVRSPGLGMITPDGKRMFFTWGITGTVQVWRLDGAQQFPVQMTGGQDATTIAGMTHDGKYLLLSRDQQGEENQICRQL